MLGAMEQTTDKSRGEILREVVWFDGMGRLVGTWPTLAMVGYALGARLGLKPKAARDDR